MKTTKPAVNLSKLSNWHACGLRFIGHFDIGPADEPFIASVDDMVVYMSIRDALELRDQFSIEIHFEDTSQDAALLKPVRNLARAWNENPW